MQSGHVRTVGATSLLKNNGLSDLIEAAQLRLVPPSLGAVPIEATFGEAVSRPRPRLSSTAAFYLQASITVGFLAGSSAPSPLYPIYQAAWGFSPLAITVIFGVYAFAVLAALLVAGRVSDHIGRRPVLLAATLVQAATMILFATASGLTGLLVARVIQGLSAGAAVAAVGAGLLDIDRARGT